MKKTILMLFAMAVCVSSAFAMMIKKPEKTIIDGVPYLELSEDGKKIIILWKLDFSEVQVSITLDTEILDIECWNTETCFCGLFSRRTDKKVTEKLKKQLKGALDFIKKNKITDWVENGDREAVNRALSAIPTEKL